MFWIIVLSLFLCESYAQLTPPGEAVCVGKQVVFFCQRSGSGTRWEVLPNGVYLYRIVYSSEVGRVLTFANHPDYYGFEIHILSSSSSSSITTELRVTAVRELNGVTVRCKGNHNENSISTIQIISDPPAAPCEVTTTSDQRQFTPSTASITLTWSASSGADNYTIMVTPLFPSGQTLVSTTTTSLQLTVLYNEEYSINITAQNCVGSNSTIVPLRVAGCSPPSPLANGSISEYSSGAVGAILTFHCDTGYMPQEEVTSTCLCNSIWVPIPECEAIDCNTPLAATGVIIEPFSNTMFGAMITFHCEESESLITGVCGGNGEWEPDPASLKCEEKIPGCSPGRKYELSSGSQVIISNIICSLVFLLLGIFLGVLLNYCFMRHKGKFKLTRNNLTPPTSAPVIYEEVSPDSHSIRKNVIELSENVAYGPVSY